MLRQSIRHQQSEPLHLEKCQQIPTAAIPSADEKLRCCGVTGYHGLALAVQCDEVIRGIVIAFRVLFAAAAQPCRRCYQPELPSPQKRACG